tara:strand:- start:826 stop:1872 length:1047 start_codon:yes stop_codon:yes gene_type:complete
MNRITAVVAGLSLAFVGTSATIADTINVPGDFGWIQGAINASSNGDVIKIAAGTFNESGIRLNGKAITIEGTLNEDGSLVTIIDGGCTEEEAEDGAGCSVFMIIDGEGPDTILRYLTITGGAGTSVYFGSDTPLGGGITIANSSPRISTCIIRDNWSSTNGAGIHCNNSSASIESCLISGNGCWEEGGGLACVNNSNVLITNCTFSGNGTADGGGAAGIGDTSNAKFSLCTFTNNTSADDKISNIYNGPMYCPECPRTGVISFVTLENCTLCGTGDHIQGLIAHVGENHISDCIDDGDLDRDGDVDTDDLAQLRGSLGLCTSDTDADGDTDIEDLLNLIEGWGNTCTP